MRTLERIAAEHRALQAEPLDASFYALLERTARRYPEREALVFFERGVTLRYAELLGRVERLAGALAGHGVAKGTRVALMLPNVPEYPITWLALARLGAVAVPVNCRFTARELGYVIADSGAEHLVLFHEYAALLEGLEPEVRRAVEGRVIAVGAQVPTASYEWSALLREAPGGQRPAEPVGLDDLLNIQYTSGTTGLPKGCRQTHRYWVVAGRAMQHIDGAHIARILAPAYYFYLDTQLMTSFALHNAATLYVANQLSATRFMDWVRAYAIQYVFLFEPIFKQPPHPRDADNSLELACILGFSKGNHAALEARFRVPARERFGMTEAGVVLHMPIDHAHMVGSGSCGVPVPFREVSIRDEAFRPVAAGEVGELWVRGPGIMEGYHDRPEANAEAFREGWLRTGDLFRRDEQGYHYVVGRIKDMIRRSEENISAHEVEAVLRTVPGVREAACVAVPDELRGEEVKAYLQLDGGLGPTEVRPEAVFAHCEGRLAHFKIPRYLEYVEALPYGPSQKVEKRKLIAAKADLRAGSFDRVRGAWG